MGQKKTQRSVVLLYQATIFFMQRIPDNSSTFTAEAKAVDLALDFIRTCDTNSKFIIFTDSLSVVESYEPYQFKESTDAETYRKMPRAFSK